MAKQTNSVNARIAKPKKKRKGIHAKSKSSKSKNAKNYLKANVGQG
jgi:hypothetical protein